MPLYPKVIVPLQFDLAIGERRYWCEEVTIDPGESGNETGTEPIKQGVCSVRLIGKPSPSTDVAPAGSGGEPGGDGRVVGSGGGAGDRRVVAEGAEFGSAGEAGAGLHVEDVVEQGVGDEDVVDEFSPSAVDPAVLLFGGELRGEVEQPAGVTLVGDGLAAGADLGAGGSEQDLGGGGLGVVVEVAEHDGGGGPAGVGEEPGEVGSQRGGFGGSLVEGVGAEAGPFVLVAGWNRPPGKVSSLLLRWAVTRCTSPRPGTSTVICRNPRLGAVAVPPVSSDWIGVSPAANAVTLSWAVIGSRDANPTRIWRGSGCVESSLCQVPPTRARRSSRQAGSPISWRASTSGASVWIVAASASSLAS